MKRDASNHLSFNVISKRFCCFSPFSETVYINFPQGLLLFLSVNQAMDYNFHFLIWIYYFSEYLNVFLTSIWQQLEFRFSFKSDVQFIPSPVEVREFLLHSVNKTLEYNYIFYKGKIFRIEDRIF